MRLASGQQYLISQKTFFTRSLVAGDTVRDLDVIAYPFNSFISGRVTAESGAPVPGMGVSISVDHRDPDILYHADTMTDSDGRYSFPVSADLDFIDYYSVSLAGVPDSLLVVPNGYDTLHSGNLSADFTLKGKSGQVKGLVLEWGTTNPLPGVRVILSAEWAPDQYATSGPDGSFNFWLDASREAGYYTVTAQASGSYAATKTSSHYPMLVDSLHPVSENIFLYLVNAPGTINGLVRLHQGSLVEDVDLKNPVQAFLKSTGDTLSLPIHYLSDTSYSFSGSVPFGIYDLIFTILVKDSVLGTLWTIEVPLALNDIVVDAAHPVAYIYFDPDSGTSLHTRSPLIREFSLDQNSPNPFNPTTNINFAVPHTTGPRGAEVTINIYDLHGSLVRTLFHGRQMPGRHSLIWDGRDGHGAALSTGVYFVRMRAGSYVKTRKIMLMK
jgi:hypothetical protein